MDVFFLNFIYCMSLSDNKGYNGLITQIDAFIRKYYRMQMLKGVLLFAALFGVVFLSVVLLEYFGQFNTTVRTMLFYGSILTTGFLLVKYIAIPLAHTFKLGKVIDHNQASLIIGNHFPEVDDKLLNTLQLKSAAEQERSSDLLMASIDQRANELSAVPFVNAVDTSENKKYLWFLLPVLLVFGVLFISKPSIVTQSTNRIVNYQNEFVPMAPFSFQVDETKLVVVEGESVRVDLNMNGDVLPNKVYIIEKNGSFVTEKISKSKYFYEFNNVQEDMNFVFRAEGYDSKKYQITVLKKPEVVHMDLNLVFPKYINRPDLKIENAGDITIPEGTSVEWNVLTKKADNASLLFSDTNLVLNEVLSDNAVFRRQVFTSDEYTLSLGRKDNPIVDSSKFMLNVVKDQHPKINVIEEQDTVSGMLRFFNGVVDDDYGLTSLNFVYTITNNGKTKDTKSKSVSIKRGTNKSAFIYHIDVSKLSLEPEDLVSYYFIVRDNDKPHGFKSTRSRTFTYKTPSLEDLADKNNQEKEEIQSKLEDAIKKAKDFKKDIADFKKSSLQKKSFDWKDVNQLNELKSDQQSLEQDLLELKNKINQNQSEQEMFNELSEQLQEKQDLINDLLENIMDEELKELLDKLQELMENQDKQEFDDQMQNLEMDSEDLQEQMDNSLELLKRLEVEEKMDQISDLLDKLAKEQKELSEDVKNKEIGKEKAQQKQKDIDDKFKQVKDDINRLMQKNDDLKKPMNLDPEKELQEQIQNEMNDAKESLEKNKSKKASDSQQNASEKMQEMSQNMQMQMQNQSQQQQGEDMKAIRMLLENIVKLSLEQENVLDSFDGLSKTNPRYVTQGKEQHRIKRDTKLVEDSLKALASRVPQIAGYVNDEMKKINSGLGNALDYFEERKTSEMNVSQQRVMTSFNNLALLLNESLEQMQQQQAQSQMSGSGSCSKPGGKGQKPSSGMNMQQMKDMLKNQIKQMEKGKNPGGKKPGESPGIGGGMGNKQISQMAREQAALREQLKKLSQQLNKDGSGKGNALNDLINDLEKQEKDLVNKKFSPEYIKRHKDIFTRLLESEKAIREQEFDNKRKSKSGENKKSSNLILLEQYKKNKLKELELLKSVPPGLNIYYKNKANEYINYLNR